MYIVTDSGLLWKSHQKVAPTPGWEELQAQLRLLTLLKRTQILCEPEPNWFGNDYAPRTQEAQWTAWNIIAEFLHMDVLSAGYHAFVSPSNSLGFKFELIGWSDTVKILVLNDGGICWDVYREHVQDANLDSSLGHYPNGVELGGEGVVKPSEEAKLIHSSLIAPYGGNESAQETPYPCRQAAQELRRSLAIILKANLANGG